MPRTWQYSRWRRLALQGAMCLVLALSVGAAAWVVQERRPPAVVLGDVQQHGILRYALPKGWDLVSDAGNEVVVTEPGPRGRKLLVIVEPRHKRAMDAEELVARRSRGTRLGDPVKFLGEEGILVETSYRTRRQSGSKPQAGEEDEDAEASDTGFGTVLVAAVVLNDGAGVLVILEGEAATGPANRALIKQVLASMRRVTDAPATTTAPGTHAATQAASQKKAP